MKKMHYVKSLGVVLLGNLCWLSVNAQPQLLTPEQLTKIENKLIGKHKLSLQWVSWERFGSVNILRDADGLSIEGTQELNGNFVSLFGKIKVIDEKAFLFTGEIVTRVDHINNGNACTRNGTFEFRATGKRQYWRLQQMKNPCDPVTDYVDVYF
ncbi:hypothetical protein ACNGTO_00395 [Bisgaard Taxon 45]|uniref:Uncharacterized protein n=1 Tax=Bisgaard Taxon 45 TaxID=304289 RepID=A0ABT9KCZ2_9PAST|nr:hypothetical protein [Bisgaard Taxon 45]